MAFFEGLVVTEDGEPVEVANVAGEAFYIVNDAGFRRHVDAREVDRHVLSIFVDQLKDHEDEASEAMLHMMGQDDLFTKGMVDATLRNINVDQMLGQYLPPDARQLLGMMGFRVVIDLHGDVVRVEMPAAPEAGYDED